MRLEHGKAGAILLFQLAACAQPPVVLRDAGVSDAGMTPIDAGDLDAGQPGGGQDAGEPDAGTPDAGEVGGGLDAGNNLDCPPGGPFGVTVGFDLPSGALTDCAGNAVNLQDLCGRKASWIFSLAGW